MAGAWRAHGGASEALEVGPDVPASDVAFLKDLGIGHTIVRRHGGPPPSKEYTDYSSEPARAGTLVVNKATPHNAEPRLDDLARTGFITPESVRGASLPCERDPRSPRSPHHSSAVAGAGSHGIASTF